MFGNIYLKSQWYAQNGAVAKNIQINKNISDQIKRHKHRQR